MLLDFADVLQVNVFHLGSVFLQLCRLFRLEEHAIVTKCAQPGSPIALQAAATQFCHMEVPKFPVKIASLVRM